MYFNMIKSFCRLLMYSFFCSQRKKKRKHFIIQTMKMQVRDKGVAPLNQLIKISIVQSWIRIGGNSQVCRHRCNYPTFRILPVVLSVPPLFSYSITFPFFFFLFLCHQPFSLRGKQHPVTISLLAQFKPTIAD